MIYRVMIVDDEPLIREGLQKLIDWKECSLEVVGCAASGEEAFKKLKKDHADILITDIKMPKLNGLELMKRCNETGMRMKYIVLSGYTDFELVKEAAQVGIENYLIKPVNKLEMIQTLVQVVEKLNVEQAKQGILNEGINILRENLLCRWITGEISFEELLERKDFLGFEIGRGYLVGILKMISLYDENYEYASIGIERGILFDKVRSSIQNSGYGICIQDPMGRLLMLFSNADHNRQRIQQNLEEFVRYLRRNRKFKVFVAMGNTVENAESVEESYYKARLTMENYELCSEREIVWYEDICQYLHRIPDFQFEQLFLLSDKFSPDDKESIFAVVENVMNSMGKMPGIKSEMLQAFAVIIVSRIFQNIISYKANAEFKILHLQERVPEVYHIFTLKEIIIWMEGIIRQALEISSQIECKYSEVIVSVIHYLEENFEKDICLKVVSDMFHMNPMYLGRMFRQETGQAFTDYLNLLRLERAKKLLEHTQLSLKQVAEKVGYQNSNYFYTVFKKCVGMTPTEFKKYITHG